jgi:hypothetical protein
VPGDRELRLVLEQLDPGHAGTFTWLDQRNASLALMPSSAAVPVQVLLELKGRGELGVSSPASNQSSSCNTCV